jgi:hypothetical protein
MVPSFAAADTERLEKTHAVTIGVQLVQIVQYNWPVAMFPQVPIQPVGLHVPLDVEYLLPRGGALGVCR